MYLLTIRDGLHTRHIGPYRTPQEAAAQLDELLLHAGEKASWQIHELEAPRRGLSDSLATPATPEPSMAAA